MLRFLATLAGISLVVWGLSSFVMTSAPLVEGQDDTRDEPLAPPAPRDADERPPKRALALLPLLAAEAEDDDEGDDERPEGKARKKDKKKGRHG